MGLTVINAYVHYKDINELMKLNGSISLINRCTYSSYEKYNIKVMYRDYDNNEYVNVNIIIDVEITKNKFLEICTKFKMYAKLSSYYINYIN